MSSLILRPAVASDLRTLFNWKNEITTRKSAFNTKPISLEEHTKWFNSALNDPDVEIYILEDNGILLGQVRINKEKSVGLIDYSIDKKYRGKGFGKKIISLLEQKTKIVSAFKAQVKKQNIASQKIFEKLGYNRNDKKTFIEYTKKINTNIIVSCKEWHRKYIDEIATRTASKIIYINQKELVTYEHLKQFHPKYILFPHWSYIIPKDVFEHFECVVFHMTDLPFGRGGSPLQNLIERGLYETKLSAIRCTKGLDSGDVYMKESLSLWGTAEEIYFRAAEMTKEMMIKIIKDKTTPTPQKGKSTLFKRRTPDQGNISHLTSLEKIFDYIRMLDADGYPHAFAEFKKLRFEFERASLKEKFIKADVKIFLKEKDNA